MTVADIVAQQETYFGRTVTVEAEVDEVFGSYAFALDEESVFRAGIDNDLLVLGKDTSALAGRDDQWLNDRARVTGTVGRLSVVEVEREVGWDLDPEIETELERSGAVLIASSISRAPLDGAPATNRQTLAPDQVASNQSRNRLPGTASPLPVAVTIGVLSLVAAAGVRAVRRRE